MHAKFQMLVRDLLEELGFACGRVTDDTDVNISTKVDTIRGDLVDSSHHLEQQALLDSVVTENGGCDTEGQSVVNLTLHVDHVTEFINFLLLQ